MFQQPSDAAFRAAQFIRQGVIKFLNPLPRSVALFGSFTGGVLHEGSDLDLLFVGQEIPRKPYARIEWFFPLSQAWRSAREAIGFNLPLSPLFISEAGWEGSIGLRLSLCDHAWVLWDDGFLSSSLLNARKLIEDGKWSRKNLPKGGWVWIERKEVA